MELSKLSWAALLFLYERTDFSEPWLGFGFATQMENEILAALQVYADREDGYAIMLSAAKYRKEQNETK